MGIELINGRGQLGDELRKRINHSSLSSLNEQIVIYHTWNTTDKSKEPQKLEYNKFKRYVDENKHKKIIFISTYSEKNNHYNLYKHKAESYLIVNCDKSLVIRLPILVGKGIIRDFIQGTKEAYGEMNITTPAHAAIQILNIVGQQTLVKSLTISGEKISAKLIKALVDEVKNEESLH
jgi:hypothetical protein